MAFVKVPNLCGASALQDELLNKFDTLQTDSLNKIENALDEEASDILDNIETALTPLGKSITDMIPSLPDTPNINFQAELKALQDFTVGSAQYIEKLATLKSQFGSVIDLDSLDLTTVEACSLDNLTLQGTKIVTQAKDIAMSTVPGSTES